jgi:hypothetical protein
MAPLELKQVRAGEAANLQGRDRWNSSSLCLPNNTLDFMLQKPAVFHCASIFNQVIDGH